MSRFSRAFLPILLWSTLVASVPAESWVTPSSHRTTINLGETPWRFLRQDVVDAKAPGFDDSAWLQVGVPHCFNDSDTFVNAPAGVRGMYRGAAWYRKHFTLAPIDRGRRVCIEFQGVNIACAVYINGHFLPNNSKVAQPGEVTHVYGFTPFVVDVTDYVTCDGKDNVLAVRVSNKPESWYVDPGFGSAFAFGMAYGGIIRPVYLHLTDPVHIPLNVFSNLGRWGTNLAAIATSADAAIIRLQTNVDNESHAPRDITLLTRVVDADNHVVLALQEAATIPPQGSHLFDQTGQIAHPHLWFPNNGSAAPQPLYHVYSVVQSGSEVLDVFDTPLGLRTITWDKDYPSFNGRKTELYGFGARYDYPALGDAVPAEQQWRDIQLAAAAGGNLLRPGHTPSTLTTVDACDYYGVALAQPSGDDEAHFIDLDAARAEYKREVHRDILVRDRNHPSVAFWEASNGGFAPGFLPELKALTLTWDPLMPRELSPRGTYHYPNAERDLDRQPDLAAVHVVGGCGDGIGTKLAYPDKAVWTAESWVAPALREDWAASTGKAETYVKKVQDTRAAHLFGFAHWYLAETAGEDYATLTWRALGCAALDGNRIPSLIYDVYKNAVFVPFDIRPGVALAGHWNLSGQVEVKAWSNCPSVTLWLNGRNLGAQKPEAPFGDHPFRCTWQVPWEAGTLKAVGQDAKGLPVCSTELITAGAPDHIELSLATPQTKPGGAPFQIEANGTDAAFVLARVVDRKGNLCPTTSAPITFQVTGPAEYRGSWNQIVTPGKPLGYHAPGDHELAAEAGQIKVAVRSTFTPGEVKVTATSPGLKKGSLSYTVAPVPR